MSRRRAKTPGWAAFDPKKQQKQVTDNETHNDPYPPISSNIGTWHHWQNPTRNGDLTGRPFSSVLTHSASVPNIMAIEDTNSRLHVANIQNVPNLIAIRDVSDLAHVDTLVENRQSENITAKYVENNVSQLYEKLKELHPWANEDLIEDMVAAVDNDIDRASALLREMASPGRLQEKKETRFEDNSVEVFLDSSMPANIGLHVGETTTFPQSAQASQNSLMVKDDEQLDYHVFSGKVLQDDNVPLGLMMDGLSTVPVEPEWEDDDMYLIHRKEAIRAMRLASRHSKAATEAYLRRDHAAAKEFSRKAREEWSTSEKLNAKAAKEILTIRNCENDDWKLDLHGLHAQEAVQVLLEHLLKIELSGTRSTNPDKTNHKARSTQAASLESVSSETEKSDRQPQSYRPRLLEVITGKGNHSRGQAALPVAIKSFLSENGYYYYEARTGVITVQPKFRQLSTALPNI